MSFKDFIEHNRQKGSTTDLVWAAIRSDGYLVVANHSSRQSLLKKFTVLKPENVFTVSEVESDKWRGREPRPVFIDVFCCYGMSRPVEDPIMGLSLREVIKRAKAVKSATELETTPE